MSGGRSLRAGWSSDPIRAVALGVVYYVAARLSLHLALVEDNVTPLWPPTGIALVGFLLYGRRLWPGVALAALAVNLPISATPIAAALTAAGNTLAPVVAATLLRRTGFRVQLDRLRDALSIVFLAALLSTLISATTGAATLVVSGTIAGADFLGAWSVWWAGDAMGILVCAPFLLTLPRFRDHPRPLGWWRGIEALCLLVVLVSVSLFVLDSRLSLLFLVLPLIGWAAWRFQQRGAAPAALVVSLLATWAAVEGRGAFANATLLDTMLTLQAFNAAVAFTSFFFAAMVTERLRARQQLEEAAAGLEERVRRRTIELSSANARLGNSERRLAEAQGLAHVGSWEWDLGTGEVSWSEEMYRMYGYPKDTPITFERAVELVVPEDRARIQANVAHALEDGRWEIPDIEYRIVRDDGSVRTLLGKARATTDDEGAVTRLVGSVQDVTERRELEREHRIAETLQRALLPERLPELPGFSFASRYLPAEEGSSAGGDWYDVFELPDGTVGLVIGDVAGHGTEAASVMGQVRTAVRAYSLEGYAPNVVVGRVHQLLRSLYDGEQMVTMLYVVVDPATLDAVVVNAGHPPPLVVTAAGEAAYLEGATGMPVGLSWDLTYEGSLARLRPGSTLVLFTDGLIDRRDISVADGLDRLRSAVAEREGSDLDALCGELLGSLVPAEVPDDVAILAARLVPASERSLELRVPADPRKLSSVRRRVGRWLSQAGVSSEDRDDIILACSEACSNAIEHAYGPGDGTVEVEAELDEGGVIIIVRDMGRWRPSRNDGRGRGLRLIESCMDSHAITRGTAGTEVRMYRAVRRRAPA